MKANGRTDKSSEEMTTLNDDPADPAPVPRTIGPSSTSQPACQTPLEGGWGWACVIGCSLVHVIGAGIGKSFGVVIVGVMERFGCSSSSAAWIGSTNGCLRMILSPVAGFLVQRRSCRAVTFLGGVVCAAGGILSSFATSPEALFFTYGIVGGIGNALTYVPSLVIVSHYFQKRKAFANGLAVSGAGIGTLAFPPIIQFLFDELGFSATLLYIGAFYLHICVSAAMYRPIEDNYAISSTETSFLQDHPAKRFVDEVPDSSQKSRLRSSVDKDLDSDESKGCSATSARRRCGVDVGVLAEPRFFLFVILHTSYVIAVTCTVSFLVPLVVQSGIDKADAALVMSVNGLMDLIGRVVYGFVLSLKFASKHSTLTYTVNLLTFSVVNLVTALCCESYFAFVSISALNGFLTGGCMTVAIVVAQDIFGRERFAKAFAAAMFFLGFFTVGAAPLAGWMADNLKTYSVVFCFTSLVNIVGAIAGAILLYLSR